MRNIIRIFISDIRKLTSNVVALVIVIGLSLLPCLYAWFNIFSNWDPYGSDATANLSVAVANEDRGSEFEDLELNVGDKIMENLEANTTINWVFVETAEDAVEGVKTGDYYAALVIDDDFTENMLSFLGDDIRHPVIKYYENDKKNAIAPKITGKVKTAIQEEINKTFINTIATYLMKISRTLRAVNGDDNLSEAGVKRLEELSTDLDSALVILDSSVSLLDSAENLVDASKNVVDQMGYVVEGLDTVSDSADSISSTAKNNVNVIADIIDLCFDEADKDMTVFNNSLDILKQTVESGGGIDTSEIDTLRMLSDAINNQVISITFALENDIEFNKQYNKKVTFDELASITDAAVEADINAGMDIDIEKLKELELELRNDFSGLDTEFSDLMDKVAAGKITKTEDLIGALDRIKSKAAKCKSDIESFRTTYNNQVKPSISKSISSVETAINSVKSILDDSDVSVARIAGALSTYPDVLGTGKKDLENTRSDIQKLKNSLDNYIYRMTLISNNESVNKIKAVLENDPDRLAEFVSEPVEIEEKKLFEIDTNGSATAPFYLVLSIWVGALILVAIIHVAVKDRGELDEAKNYQKFFGRYIIFFLIGQIQTLITVLGAFFYLGIQCKHHILLWFACSVTSFTFTMIMYSLTYGFGAVGEAIAVVLMVLQVAGTGGTFPIEVLPRLYQVLYKFMPFSYALSALRECVAGFYQQRYWLYLEGLLTYVIISVVIGMVFNIINRKMHHVIEKAKSGTDLMI